jgi:hypothetical protein
MIRAKTLLNFAILLSLAAPAQAAKKDAKKDGRDASAGKQAADRGTIEARERLAKRACLNGDAAKGVELLTDLYVDTNLATYIFNQGRCYEQNGRCEEAIIRFREYLRKSPRTTESDRGDVQKHINDCEALIAKQAAEAKAPVTPAAVAPAAVSPATIASSVTAPATAAPAAQSPSVPPQVVVASRLPSSSGSGMRTAGIVTLSVGGAALIAGMVFNLQHNSTIHDLKADYGRGTASTADTYKTLSMVGYGAGAACLVGGAALYYLGWRAGRVEVAPAMVAGNAGVLLAGEF